VSDAKEAFKQVVHEAQNCNAAKPLTKTQQAALINSERELSNAVHSLEVALGQCSADLGKVQFEQLKKCRSELKDSLTDSDTPYPGPYESPSLSRIRQAQTKMRDELTRIAFAINRR
jgi:molecular chaperone DnaK (HSP70)